MKNQIYQGVLVLLMTSVRVECRTWQALVDHQLVHKSNIDSSRYELKIEADPFAYPGDESPTVLASEAPKAEAVKAWNTIGSSGIGSISKESAVNFSMKPAAVSVEQSSGCGNGLEHYEVHMMDTWGDGWGQTMITITGMSNHQSMETTHTNAQGDEVVAISKTVEFGSSGSAATPPGQIFQGSLEQGYHDFADICLLPNQCYQVIATGGEFSAEVSWELRKGKNDTPMLTGGAQTGCTFSLPNQNGMHVCPNTCSDEIQDNGMEDTPKLSENEDTSDLFAQAVGRAGPSETTSSSFAVPLPSTGNSDASAMWSKFNSN